MRRKDKEITDPSDIDAIIEMAPVCRIALADGNTPYVVPVCFGYDGRSFYIHGAREGRKMEILKTNPKVCIEIDVHVEPKPSDKPCSWSMRYKSVIATGRAVFLEDVSSKRAALDIIMMHYTSGSARYQEQAIESMALIKIPIETLTAKRSGF